MCYVFLLRQQLLISFAERFSELLVFPDCFVVVIAKNEATRNDVLLRAFTV